MASAARASFVADDAFGLGGEIDIPDPAAGQAGQPRPAAHEGPLEDNAEHAVVVKLDLGR